LANIDCPECRSPLMNITSNFYTMRVCLNCGYYESDSPAFRNAPSIFKDCVRNNPEKFLKKYIIKTFIRRIFTERKPDKDFTKPVFKLNYYCS